MNNPLGVSPSKENQGATQGKEKIFWPQSESDLIAQIVPDFLCPTS